MCDYASHHGRDHTFALPSTPFGRCAGIPFPHPSLVLWRASPQAGADTIRHGVFKVMAMTAVLGVIAIRVIDIFTVSQSIVLTVCCMVISAVLEFARWVDRDDHDGWMGANQVQTRWLYTVWLWTIYLVGRMINISKLITVISLVSLPRSGRIFWHSPANETRQ